MKIGTPRHPKTLAMMTRLNISRPVAVGTLELLWQATAEYAPQGDIGKFTDEEIAALVEWQHPSITPKDFVRTLCDIRWLDPSTRHRLIIHDWHQHAPDYLRKRLSRAGLDFYGKGRVRRSADNGVQNDVSGAARPPTQPNHAVPNPTMPNQEKDSFASASAKPAATKAIPIVFLPEERRFTGVTDKDKATWTAAFPGVDQVQEVHKAIAWIMADWPRRTRKNWRKFLTNWFSKAQESAGQSRRLDEVREPKRGPLLGKELDPNDPYFTNKKYDPNFKPPTTNNARLA